MLPKREQAQNLQTHTKIINATYVTEFPAVPLPSPALTSSSRWLLEQGVPFRGTKTSRRVDVFWPRADAPVVTFTQLPTPPLPTYCCCGHTHNMATTHSPHTHAHVHTAHTQLPHTSYYCQAKPNKTWFIKWQHSLQFVSYQLEKEQWPMHDKTSAQERARERGR